MWCAKSLSNLFRPWVPKTSIAYIAFPFSAPQDATAKQKAGGRLIASVQHYQPRYYGIGDSREKPKVSNLDHCCEEQGEQALWFYCNWLLVQAAKFPTISTKSVGRHMDECSIHSHTYINRILLNKLKNKSPVGLNFWLIPSSEVYSDNPPDVRLRDQVLVYKLEMNSTVYII